MTDTIETRHDITIDASADQIFDLLADVGRWSGIFPPTVHGRRVSGNEYDEVIELWATAGDEMRHWMSTRKLDRHGRTIAFEQTVPAVPLRSMSGRWVITPDGPRCHVSLFHHFSIASGHEDSSSWVSGVVDTNSNKELQALRAAVQDSHLSVTFDDTIEVPGKPEIVFEFLNRSDLWPERLAHVSAMNLEQLSSEEQTMTMTTRTVDGGEHVTRSHRVCLPEVGIIAYKQTQPPKLLSAHAGLWRIEVGSPTLLTAEHRITIDPDNVKAVVGDDATVDTAKDIARTALMHNSRITMLAAAQFAERAGSTTR